jgi:hypothetical protein
MTRGGTFLSFFLLVELTIEAPSYCFIYDNKRQASVDLWLLLNKWGKKDDMVAFRQGKADGGLTCKKWWLHHMPSGYD